MKWYERMKTQIKIGENYETREGHKVCVVRKIQYSFLVKRIDVTNTTIECFMCEYLVNSFGGFGNYPNHLDLVNHIIK